MMDVKKDEINQLIENESQLIKRYEKTLNHDLASEISRLESELKTLTMEKDDVEYELKKTKSDIAIRSIEVEQK